VQIPTSPEVEPVPSSGPFAYPRFLTRPTPYAVNLAGRLNPLPIMGFPFRGRASSAYKLPIYTQADQRLSKRWPTRQVNACAYIAHRSILPNQAPRRAVSRSRASVPIKGLRSDVLAAMDQSMLGFIKSRRTIDRHRLRSEWGPHAERAPL